MAVLLLEGCLWEVQHLCLLQCCEEYASAQPYPNHARLPALQNRGYWLICCTLHTSWHHRDSTHYTRFQGYYIKRLLINKILESEQGRVQG